MKKIIIGLFLIGSTFNAKAQKETIYPLEELGTLISHSLKNNKVKELESLALEIKGENSDAYYKLCAELAFYFMGKEDFEKYNYYSRMIQEGTDDVYILDGIKFNEITLNLSKLGHFIKADEIEEHDKSAILELATSPTFYGTMACELSFKYFNSRPCENIASDIKSKQLSESQSSVNDAFQLEIFPNPSNSGRYNVELTGFQAEKEIKVFNTLGVIVWEVTTYNDEVVIDISSFSKGMYFIKVTDRENEKTERILFN